MKQRKGKIEGYGPEVRIPPRGAGELPPPPLHLSWIAWLHNTDFSAAFI